MDMQTERLHIRDFVEADLPALYELQSEPAILRFVGWPRADSASDSARWLAETMEHNRAEPRFAHNCAIVIERSGEVAGWIGFGHATEKKRFGELDFGYAILPRFWGNGYMTEALRGALDFIFQTAEIIVIQDGPPLEGVPRRRRAAASVFGECAVANPASARVMEKAGMRRVAEFENVNARSAETAASYRYFIDREAWAALTSPRGR
jgi:ribosomal-protein-alanine N-acetyltransferase